MTSCAQALVQLLEGYGVESVFGIPGVHTVELYRGLHGSSLRHISPRHEQGAGFMADGYARASGKPGVCFVITGPGVTNAATAIGQGLRGESTIHNASAISPTPASVANNCTCSIPCAWGRTAGSNPNPSCAGGASTSRGTATGAAICGAC